MTVLIEKNLRLISNNYYLRGLSTVSTSGQSSGPGTDRNQLTKYRYSKVLVVSFIRPALAGLFRSVSVLCREKLYYTIENESYYGNEFLGLLLQSFILTFVLRRGGHFGHLIFKTSLSLILDFKKMLSSFLRQKIIP
jgi:hypothetical protein